MSFFNFSNFLQEIKTKSNSDPEHTLHFILVDQEFLKNSSFQKDCLFFKQKTSWEEIYMAIVLKNSNFIFFNPTPKKCKEICTLINDLRNPSSDRVKRLPWKFTFWYKASLNTRFDKKTFSDWCEDLQINFEEIE